MWVAWLWKLLRNKRFRAWLLATAGPRAIALFLVWIERVRHRQVAIGEARQVDGMFSAAIIDGERHVVVWKDGEPISSYPPVEGDLAAKLRSHARRDLTRPEDLPTTRARRWASEAARRVRGGAQSVGEHARGGAQGVSKAAREGTHHLGEGAHALRQLLPGRGDGDSADSDRGGGA